jgi:hypothetical protein
LIPRFGIKKCKWNNETEIYEKYHQRINFHAKKEEYALIPIKQ